MKITYCPICNKTTFHSYEISDVVHCSKCGHHLNFMEYSKEDMMKDNNKALETIEKIVEVIEAWEEFKDGNAGYECFSQIRDIMKKGGWT